MEALLEAMANNWFWTVMGGVAIVAILSGTITTAIKSSARERSRREIAAYIAEGSMTPDQGERILDAGDKDACA